MCLCREEGGAREVLYARIRRSIRQNSVEIAALEAGLRRRRRESDALRAEIMASYHQIARLQAELTRIRAELARVQARVRFHQRANFLSFLLSLLSFFLLGFFTLSVSLKMESK